MTITTILITLFAIQIINGMLDILIAVIAMRELRREF